MSPAVERARLLLADVLGLDPAVVADDAGIQTLAAWDSLAHVRVMLRLEEELGRPLAPEEVLGIRDLAGIGALLQPDETR